MKDKINKFLLCSSFLIFRINILYGQCDSSHWYLNGNGFFQNITVEMGVDTGSTYLLHCQGNPASFYTGWMTGMPGTIHIYYCNGGSEVGHGELVDVTPQVQGSIARKDIWYHFNPDYGSPNVYMGYVDIYGPNNSTTVTITNPSNDTTVYISKYNPLILILDAQTTGGNGLLVWTPSVPLVLPSTFYDYLHAGSGDTTLTFMVEFNPDCGSPSNATRH